MDMGTTMKHSNETSRLTYRALQHYAWLAIFYTALIFVLPVSPATTASYHLSELEYRVVEFAVALPTLAVWLAAFVSYASLRGYARYIRKTPEGIYYDQLAEGLTWLAWSLPVSTITRAVLNAIAVNHPAFHAGSVIIGDYISLILPLIAFSVIANASRGLLGTVKIKPALLNSKAIVAGFMALGVFYCILTFRHFDLSSLGSTQNPYFLPIWLMVLTVTVPYLYAWFMGVLAAFEITLYRRHVAGVLYKQPLGLLVGGLLIVILSSMAVQYMFSISPPSDHLVLNVQLVFSMIFRVIRGVGFVLIILGARRLQKIEEV